MESEISTEQCNQSVSISKIKWVKNRTKSVTFARIQKEATEKRSKKLDVIFEDEI